MDVATKDRARETQNQGLALKEETFHFILQFLSMDLKIREFFICLPKKAHCMCLANYLPFLASTKKPYQEQHAFRKREGGSVLMPNLLIFI